MITVTVLEYTAAVNVQDQTATVSAGAEIVTRNPEEYTGETEVTPTMQTQTLLTMNKTVPQNIVINPIPSNYGLITWDGSKLTVS